jgi:hypothetical protein
VKIILIVFFALLAFACSGEVENNKTPNNKPSTTKSLPSNPLPLHSQPNQPEEHISGGGDPRISGATSSHVSGND